MPVTSNAWDQSSRSFGRSAMICSTTRGFIRKHLIHFFTAFITVFLPPIGQYWDRIMPSNARGQVCRLRSWKWVIMAIVTEWLRGNIIGWRPLKSREEFLSRPSTLRSQKWSMNGERDASEHPFDCNDLMPSHKCERWTRRSNSSVPPWRSDTVSVGRWMRLLNL